MNKATTIYLLNAQSMGIQWDEVTPFESITGQCPVEINRNFWKGTQKEYDYTPCDLRFEDGCWREL